MKKNAFTLIELLTVIVILGIIAGITIPTINGIIKNSKEKAYNEQINVIVDAAKRWGIDNTFALSTTSKISVATLKSEGYISNKKILKNPIDNTSIENACVKITYDENTKQYKYAYSTDCS